MLAAIVQKIRKIANYLNFSDVPSFTIHCVHLVRTITDRIAYIDSILFCESAVLIHLALFFVKVWIHAKSLQEEEEEEEADPPSKQEVNIPTCSATNFFFTLT